MCVWGGGGGGEREIVYKNKWEMCVCIYIFFEYLNTRTRTEPPPSCQPHHREVVVVTMSSAPSHLFPLLCPAAMTTEEQYKANGKWSNGNCQHDNECRSMTRVRSSQRTSPDRQTSSRAPSSIDNDHRVLSGQVCQVPRGRPFRVPPCRTQWRRLAFVVSAT